MQKKGNGLMVRVINLTETPQYRLCQIIDLAGFKTDIKSSGIRLYDKKNPKADEYSSLEFKSLFEAIRAVEPYIKDRFKFVA
jgi:hypothetical protein